jgi:hypothetical protein
MAKARLQLFGLTGKYATVDIDATEGAVVGKNLRWADGSLVSEAEIRAKSATPASGSDVSDDIDEGRFNLYFTTQRAQDAVGGILADTDTIDFTYNGTTHVIKADLKVLADAGGGALVKIQRDAYGRVAGTSSATTDDLSEGSTHLYFTKPRVAASLIQGTGIELDVDGSGNTRISLVVEDGGVLLTDWAGNQLTDWTDVDLEDWTPAAVDVASVFGRYGNVVAVSGDYNTSQVTENAANLYFTAPRVRSTTLTGMVTTSATAVSATDTVLVAVGKLQAQVSARQVIGQPVVSPIYTLSTLPAATVTTATVAAHVFCSDLVEGLGPLWSDGTNWRRFTDNTVAN